MQANSVVICSLSSPKEKIWGLLKSLDAAGIYMRGIDINSFDDFIRQVVNQEENIVGLGTIFFPMHRVERIALDEPSGSLPSLSDQFYKRVGVTIEDYLGLHPTVM